ncbi:hypothetical protein DDZ14_15915 [Maritimibacter sp. 55A14]|uniref:Hint domain-containing protein n=1 Tax=Maritimibacter sp. 55A14 TaxID=2174844 RepID=UPI000D60F83A|nr:Hint domain-containing protein [Maritimibacter sp. 55A14]PWE30044.1 hypothetical protein DDZ14_15915 [Maritimibacter sp. 55A14]
MVTRTVTIYEVPNSYVSSGGTVVVLNSYTLSFEDDDGFLDATQGADSGAAQVLTSDAGAITDYEFFFDDSVRIDGSAETVKTFQLTINGTTRSFIMNDTGDSIPGASTGSTVQLSTFSNYTAVDYNDIPCLAEGTHITTEDGEIAVEDLRVGSMVRTLDNGYQPLRWVGSVHLTQRQLLAQRKFAPVCIAPGALGPDLPRRALVVSPQHRILLDGWEMELHFGCDEALAPALSLIGRPGISGSVPTGGITYYHLLFDRHEIIFAEGLATESFYVGDTIRAGMDGEQLAEILELFPQLGRQYGPLSETARMVLRSQEVGALYSEFH